VTTQDQVKWEDVLERLARIRALADRAGTLEEAEAATAALSRLLLRYNLSLADLDVASRPAERAGVESRDLRLANSAGWRHYLLHALAQCHFCRAIRYPGTDRATLIGHPHNIAAVSDLHAWLAVSLERLALDAWDAERPHGGAGKRAWLNAFRTGAVDGLWKRLLDERERLRAEEEGRAWALAPLLDAEVDAYLAEAFAALNSYRVVTGDARGYRAGRAAGYEIDISRQGIAAG